jgi:hypothetical protein
MTSAGCADARSRLVRGWRSLATSFRGGAKVVVERVGRQCAWSHSQGPWRPTAHHHHIAVPSAEPGTDEELVERELLVVLEVVIGALLDGLGLHDMKAVVLALALFGCWHFTTPVEPPPVEPPPVESRVPGDARRDAVRWVDAGAAETAEAGADTAMVAPVPRVPPVDAAVVVVPPGCVVGRVIGMTLVGSEVVLTIGAGSNRGVATSWTVTLTGPPQTRVRILRVDRAVTVVKLSGLTLDAVRVNPIVVLCP